MCKAPILNLQVLTPPQQHSDLVALHNKTIATLRKDVAPLPRLREELKAWKAAVQACETGIRNLKTERDAALARVDALSKERDEDRTCLAKLREEHAQTKQALDDERQRSAVLSQARDDALDQRDDANRRLEVLKEELAASMAHCTSITRERNDATRELGDAAVARDVAEKQRDDAMKRLAELQARSSSSEAVDDMKEHCKRATAANDLLGTVRARNSALQDRDASHAQIQHSALERDTARLDSQAQQQSIDARSRIGISALLNPESSSAAAQTQGNPVEDKLRLQCAMQTPRGKHAYAIEDLQTRLDDACGERDRLAKILSRMRRKRGVMNESAERDREALGGLLNLVVKTVGSSDRVGELRWMKEMHENLVGALQEERLRSEVCHTDVCARTTHILTSPAPQQLSAELESMRRTSSDMDEVFTRGANEFAQRLVGLMSAFKSSGTAKVTTLDPATIAQDFASRLRTAHMAKKVRYFLNCEACVDVDVADVRGLYLAGS